MMNKAPILEIEPKELKFIFELKKQSSCSVQLTNNTNHHVAFKIKTTSVWKYCAGPNVGVLAPKSTCELIVTMQAQQVAPEEMVCKDKFLIQSTLVPAKTTKDVTASLFVKDGMRYVEESKLNVALISPPNSPEIPPVNGDSKNQQFDHEKVQIYSKDEIQSPKPMVLISNSNTISGLIMNKMPILEVEPKELIELMKQCSCSVQLTNKTYHHVAFKMKTTSPKKYCVRPNVGVMAPKSTCKIIFTMQAQQVAPEEMVCKDKFLIQSTLVPAETTKDVTASLFVKDGMRYVEESKLNVALISPPYSPEIPPVNGDSKNQQFDHEKVQIYSKDEIQSPKPMVLISNSNTISGLITNKMTILEAGPKELQFIFELMKQCSCSVQLTNKTYHHVAFKIKTNSPRKYCVRPNVGVLAPKSTCEFTVIMRAQKVAPEEMVCKDMFLIQSTLVPAETTKEDVTASLFVKDGMRYVEESKLNVALISPPNSPEIAPVNGDSKNLWSRQFSSIATKIAQLYSGFWPSCNTNGYTRLL